MTASTRPPLTFLAFLTLLVCGEAANVLHLRPKQTSSGSAPFYKRLASKVDSLAVDADFNVQEKNHATPTAGSANNGADVLKHWSATHDASEPLVNASALGLELGGYALHVRDQNKLKAAAQAHAVMHRATSAHADTSQSPTSADSVSSAAGPALAASGSDLLRKWSASHSASAPRPAAKVTPAKAPQEVSDTTRPASAKEVGPAHVAEKPKSKDFTR